MNYQDERHADNSTRYWPAPTPHAPSEDTPETDAMERVLMADDSSTPAQTFEMCMDFARSLERRLRASLAERDDAKARLESERQRNIAFCNKFASLKDELSEARKDTERLDWLEVVGTKGEEFHWTPTYKGPTLRAAIDATLKTS